LKRAFNGQDLLSFGTSYVSSDSYPNLSQDAKNFTALFGSTYYTAASNLFSAMKNTKTKSRSLLADEHLTASLCILTSTVGADTDYLRQQKQCQVSHYTKLISINL